MPTGILTPTSQLVTILQKSDPQRYTLGVVYEPDTVDSQGDFADASEIEKACWEFNRMMQGQSALTKTAYQLLGAVAEAVKKNQAVQFDITDLMTTLEKNGTGLGFQHSIWTDSIGDIVESYISPVEMTVNGETVKKGSWLMGIVWSPEYYTKVQNNEMTGLSLGGTAVSVPTEGGVPSAQ